MGSRALVRVGQSKPGRDGGEFGQHGAVITLKRRHLGLRIDALELWLVLLSVLQADLLEAIWLPDLLHEDVNAERASAGRVVEVH